VISSFGKSLHITGWKVGYCLAPEALTVEFRKVHQFVTFSTSTPFQFALAQYLQNYRDRFLSVAALYQKKKRPISPTDAGQSLFAFAV
jgi:methionine aminotransferase